MSANESAELDNVLLIVVGTHLRAEKADRPLAYRLKRRIERWQDQHAGMLEQPIEPLVCSDVWYLNNQQLQERPTISLGGPGVNALSAFFTQNLPREADHQQQVLIQIDPDFTDLRACIWGTNHKLTVKGLDVFINQYLDGYLRAVATQVTPKEE